MRKLIFFLLTTILISCDSASRIGDAFGITAFCHPEIQYHLSSDCEDSPEITASEIVLVSDFIITIDGIEVILNEAEIGECVLVNLIGFTSNNGESLGNVYIVNDADKSWLVKDCFE